MQKYYLSFYRKCCMTAIAFVLSGMVGGLSSMGGDCVISRINSGFISHSVIVCFDDDEEHTENAIEAKPIDIADLVGQLISANQEQDKDTRLNLITDIQDQIRSEIKRIHKDALSEFEPDIKESVEQLTQDVMDIAYDDGIVLKLRTSGFNVIPRALLLRIGQPDVNSLTTHSRIAEWAYLTGEFNLAIESLKVILENTPEDLYALCISGGIYGLQDRFDKAEEQFNRLIELSPADSWWDAAARGGLSAVYRENKEGWDKAEQYAREALEIYTYLDSQDGIARSYRKIGVVISKREDFDEAERLFQIALDIYKETGNKRGTGVIYNNLGVLFHNQYQYAEAEVRYKKAIQMCTECNNLSGLFNCTYNLGAIYQERRDYSNAISQYTKAIKISNKIDSIRMAADATSSLAWVYSHSGEYDKAESKFLGSIALYKQLDDSKMLAWAYVSISSIYYYRDEYELAENYVRKSLAINERSGSMSGISYAHGILGNIYSAREKYDDASKHYQQSLELATQGDEKEQVIHSLMGLGSLYFGHFDIGKVNSITFLRLKYVKRLITFRIQQ